MTNVLNLFLKSFLTLQTYHQAVDKVNIWLHIPLQMTNVLNLFGYLVLKFLYIDIVLTYDILVLC